MIIGVKPRKKFVCNRIDAPRSRQPLVKGERLIRYELSAAMLFNDFWLYNFWCYMLDIFYSRSSTS